MTNQKDQEVSELEYTKFTKHLFEMFRTSKPLVLPTAEKVFTGKLEESAVLMLSDVHIGKVNYFTDLENNKSYQTYNSEIFVKEANKLLERVTEVNQLLSASYDIKKLYIFGLGDLVDNDLIMRGHKFFVDVGVGAQLMLGVRVFSDFITELLKTFEEIEFWVVGGN